MVVVALTSACGRDGYPGGFINGGQTEAVTMQYGTALGYSLSGSGYGPVLRGCTPHIAIIGIQAPYFYQWTIQYNDHQLVTSTTSNDTANFGTYQLSYETVPTHLAASTTFAVRPVNFWPQGTNDDRNPETSNATFSYDTRGRLKRVVWSLSSNSSVMRQRSRAGVAPDSPFLHRENHPPLPRLLHSGTAPFLGFEEYNYTDVAHPRHATEYRSGGVLGEASAGYTFESDDAGQVQRVSQSAFVASKDCSPKCATGSYCCKDAFQVGNESWCSSKSCQAMGHLWLYKYDDNNEVVAVAVDGHDAQQFKYNENSALVAIQQNVSSSPVDMLQTKYADDGSPEALVAFVIYPLVPESWQFKH